MRIVERENIDVEKWNELVAHSTDSSFYSYSWYLDATAENWCIFIDDEYKNGIALPYTKRLNTEFLYTPIFVTYLEVFGSIDTEKLESLILKRFKRIDFCVKQSIFSMKPQEFVYQEINRQNSLEYSKQAKRNIDKALKSGLSCIEKSEFKQVKNVVDIELSGKYNGLDEISLKRLNSLFTVAKNCVMLHTFQILINDKVCGGIICLRSSHRLLYVKGAVIEEYKKKGGMYLALHQAIQYAKSSNLNFDFGGSRVEGVRRFNLNLGGRDEVFFNYLIDNSPLWFKLLRKLNKLKKF